MNSSHSSFTDSIFSRNPGLAFHAFSEASSSQSETETNRRGSPPARRSRDDRNPGMFSPVHVIHAVQRSTNSSAFPSRTCHSPEAHLTSSIAGSFSSGHLDRVPMDEI